MKHRYLLLGVLMIALLLSACSGAGPEGQTSEPLEESSPPPAAENQPEIQPEPQPEEEPPAELAPSTTFEQSYYANPVSDRDYSEYEIITLLPPDGIPALTNPTYYSVERADEEYLPDEMVIGIEFNGDARVYSVGMLSSHEIVNDTVGGIHLAVTW